MIYFVRLSGATATTPTVSQRGRLFDWGGGGGQFWNVRSVRPPSSHADDIYTSIRYVSVVYLAHEQHVGTCIACLLPMLGWLSDREMNHVLEQQMGPQFYHCRVYVKVVGCYHRGCLCPVCCVCVGARVLASLVHLT